MTNVIASDGLSIDLCQKENIMHHIFIEEEDLSAQGQQYICPKGKSLVDQETLPEKVYFIHSGTVRLFRKYLFRKKQVGTISGKKLLGLKEVLLNDRYKYEAVAGKDTLILEIPKREFFALLNRNPRLRAKIMELLSKGILNITPSFE